LCAPAPTCRTRRGRRSSRCGHSSHPCSGGKWASGRQHAAA
jgi:hypothetical protein